MTASATSLAAPLPSPGPTMDRAKAMAAARDFEAVYLADAFKLMMQGVSADPLSDGSGAESWRELLVDEYAKDMVRRGGIGLAGPIADQLIRIQEAATE